MVLRVDYHSLPLDVGMAVSEAIPTKVKDFGNFAVICFEEPQSNTRINLYFYKDESVRVGQLASV